MDAVPKKHRWYQFSLRTMLVVVIVVLAALGYAPEQNFRYRLVRSFSRR
jgi:hypothetical protein